MANMIANFNLWTAAGMPIQLISPMLMTKSRAVSVATSISIIYVAKLRGLFELLRSGSILNVLTAVFALVNLKSLPLAWHVCYITSPSKQLHQLCSSRADHFRSRFASFAAS